MAYSVEFSARARRDIDEIVAFIQGNSQVEATRWRQRLERKIESLRTMPDACGVAPESGQTVSEVRQLLYGRYRVIFTIRERAVFILTIRHGARQLLAADELDSIA